MNEDGRIESRDLCSSSVIERVLSDEAVSSIKIKKTIQSDNFSAGVSGWRINRDTGSCEFQDAVIRGTLNASDITAGSINASVITITNINATNISTGTLSVARIGANSIDMSKIELTAALETNQEIRSSSYTAGSSGWRIQANGAAEFNSVTVRGTIIAGTSSSVDWSYIANVSVTNAQIASLAASKITAGTISAQEIILSNSTSSILRSSNYVAGTSGWRIRGDGVAEFQNVTIRGTLNASDLTAGTLAVARIGAASIDMSKIELTAALETNQLIRSTVYTAGSAGWQISANGNAEFNNVTVRGTLGVNTVSGWLTTGTGGGFRTAASGQRIQIRQGAPDRFELYSGTFNDPAYIQITDEGLSNPVVKFVASSQSGAAQLSLIGQQFSIWSNNAAALTVNASGVTPNIPVRGTFGTAAAPAYSFSGDTDTGMYAGVGQLLFSCSNGLRAVLDTNRWGIMDGTQGIPAHSFINDTDTGMYRITTNTLGFSTGNQLALNLGPNADKYIYGLTTGTTNALHFNTSTGQITYVSSRRAIKKNIKPLPLTGDFDRLRPVRYDMRDGSRDNQFGFIAEEVADLFPSLAIWGHETATGPDAPDIGERMIVNYEDRGILALLVAEVQDARRRIAVLEAA